MNIKQIFANNVKYYREKKQLTQQDLAEITGLNRVYISNVERAKRNITIDIMEKLSNGLDVELKKLLTKK
ncbi:MAG: helix-turn-helix transcriptional regulator [Phascolarctobacterium sp.]|nr:helix-turn-helix transcriptional regulator [Candidatus Phascolarctobacterium caballi]